jgi:hypothetical protein
VPSAPTVSTPSEAPPPGAAAAPSQEIKTQPKKKEKEKKDILSRIGDRLEARTQMYDASKPATFGPMGFDIFQFFNQIYKI